MDGRTYGRTDRPSYRDAINDDLSDVPPVFKAIITGSECYHNHDDRHGDICLKNACDPWSLRILILHGKWKNKKRQKLKNSIAHLLTFFKMQKKFILFPSKNYQWRKNFFQKSSVQWKLINFNVLNCQFWSDCRQIYTGSKHWYNFLKFIVIKTKKHR